MSNDLIFLEGEFTEQQREEATKMMDFLDVEKFRVSTHIYMFYIRKDMTLEIPIFLHVTYDKLLEVAHKQMVNACREKALRKWTDIELANNNLFWCMYE